MSVMYANAAANFSAKPMLAAAHVFVAALGAVDAVFAFKRAAISAQVAVDTMHKATYHSSMGYALVFAAIGVLSIAVSLHLLRCLQRKS